MPGISLDRRALAAGRSCFESFTPSVLNLSSFSSSIITPAMTSGPITGPLPASSTPQTLKRPLSRFPDPVVDLTYYPAIDRFTILFRNLPVHTFLPHLLHFWIARSVLHCSDNCFVSVQDPGNAISEGSASHFHRSDLVHDDQVRRSLH